MKGIDDMRVLICGVDGYLGWSLARHLAARGHEIAGIDDYSRRRWVAEMRSDSALPIASMTDRLQVFKETFGRELLFSEGDLKDYSIVERVFREFEPEAVVHLGECPSAPYSMIDVHHATDVHNNNVGSTFNLLFALRDLAPDAHLLKLGTMGEYGTPNVEIPEGFFEIEYRGRSDKLPFPRQANSFYHWSKVSGSNHVMFASKIWGLPATDVMQGVVFGTRIDKMDDDERLLTRLDFDQCFGTAINRFSCQAVIGHPLTLFGKGGQKRGFLPLRDSMQCLTLALENPPEHGEYRVFNQFEEVYNLTQLALKVQRAAAGLGMEVEVSSVENPRTELEDHFYEPDHHNLLNLGYKPTHTVETEITFMLEDLQKYSDRIEMHRDVFMPDVRWDGGRAKSKFI
jgi:UDP-sulfoquinovose synthase